MQITQLGSRDFYLAGRNKKTLNISLGGNVLVFFKMQGCQGCRAFEPIFYQLSKSDKRVSYAICDISTAIEVPKLSRQTNNQSQAVPWIFFYSDGFPVARFKGKKNIPSIQAFVGKALIEAQSRKRRAQSNFVPQGQTYGHQEQRNWKQPPKNSSYLGEVEEEEDPHALMPTNVTPHNKPWESEYRKMNSFD